LEIVEEIDKCRTDEVYFIENYCYINNPHTFETFKFEFWDFQHDVLKAFKENRRLIILKARQLGISWIVAAHALWVALFHNNANVLILSQKEDLAMELLNKVKFMNERLPDWLKMPVGNENLRLLEFSGKRFHSQIKALPATADAGRSETASLVIADEWAFHPYAEKNYGALSPTIDAGGSFIGISTANGMGDFFHRTWMKSVAGVNNFKNLFLDYSMRPERRAPGWYEQALQNYTGDPKMFQREYPRTPEEAFITTGGCVFDLEGLQYILDNHTSEPLTLEFLDAKGSRLAALKREYPDLYKFWTLPRPGQQFVIGADPAGGGADADWSVGIVLDMVTGEHVATLRGRLDPDAFAGHLVNLAEAYNNATLAVERNNHGYGVHEAIKSAYGYGRIYQYPDDKKQGWPTNSKTKAIMVTKLQSVVRERTLSVKDADFIYEAQSYVQDGNKVGASEGMNDDYVTAMGVALCARESAPKRSGSPVKRVVQRRHFRSRAV